MIVCGEVFLRRVAFGQAKCCNIHSSFLATCATCHARKIPALMPSKTAVGALPSLICLLLATRLVEYVSNSDEMTRLLNLDYA